MDSRDKILYGAAILYSCVLGFFSYVRIWELKQPEQVFEAVSVQRVQYYSGKSELGSFFRGHEVFIQESDIPIDFSGDLLSNEICEGKKVDIRARRMFPLVGERLEGLCCEMR